MGKNKNEDNSPATLQAATSRALSEDKDFQPNTLKYTGKSARFQADRDAFKHRFHDPLINAQLQPADPRQQPLFAALEEERYLSKGYQRFPGVAKHLPRGKFLPKELKEVIGYLRHRWGHKATKKTVVSDNLKPLLESLVESRSQQEKYANAVYELLESLVPSTNMDESREKLTQVTEKPQDVQSSESLLLSQLSSPSRGESRKKRRKVLENEEDFSPTSTSQHSELSQDRLEYDESYHPYTRRFDRVVRAETIADQEERKQLKTLFQETLDETDMRHTNRLITRLRSVLQSQSQTKPQFDQEQGVLHPPRLSRLVTSQKPLIYKHMENRPFLETTISLLIDNSGSMRGRPIRLAAISAYLLAETLNKCNMPVEILGFTTSRWNGGKTRNLWMEAGKPPHPGRLNDLLHIIYKDSDTSWQKGRKQIGLMLKEGLLKENIDGEALLWAYHRLQRRDEPRKILIVISDGAPVDDATLAANPGSYLDNHLRTTVSAIEGSKDIELLAIGIGHDVGQYYSQSVTLDSVEHLGSTLFEQLIRLLTQSQSRFPSAR